VKKLISIGVALALLAMVVMPIGAAAYTDPSTYAKVPFAIVQSGFDLIGIIIDAAGSTLGLPAWLDSALMGDIGEWAGGPLSWSVDMMAWGVSLFGVVLADLDAVIGAIATLPFELSSLSELCDDIACQLLTAWAPAAGGNFTPCG
jgi:hypothetical protein